MNRFHSSPNFYFLLILFFPVSALSEVREWTDTKGRTMQADVSGFDSETRQIQFSKSDGQKYAFPFQQLNLKSKFQALSDSTFRSAAFANSDKIEKSFWINLAIILVGLSILTILLVYPISVWLAVRLREGSYPFTDHFRASLYLGVLEWVHFLTAPLYLFALFKFADQIHGIQIAYGLLGLGFSIAMVYVFVRNYDLTFGRGLIAFLLWCLFTAIGSIMIWMVLFGVGFFLYQNSPELIHPMMDKLFFTPLGLS